MAVQVIDAGRFDQKSTMDERRATLEAMLQVSVLDGCTRLVYMAWERV